MQVDPGNDFVSGFSSTPVEVTFAIAFILFFVLALSIYSFRSLRLERERRALENARLYREHLDARDLSGLDRDALERLIRHLPPSVPAYRIFEEQGVFNRAAGHALESGSLERAEVTTLRVKLGLTGTMVGSRPRSSTEIPVGRVVELHGRLGRGLECTVLPPTSGAFRLQAPATGLLPPTGSRVSVVYPGSSGLFSFASHLLRRQGRVLELEHSEELSARQRRDHARRPAEVTVLVEELAGSHDPWSTLSCELGGGGATLVNPEGRFRAGSELLLTLCLGELERLEVRGRVIRTSGEGGELMHLRWVGLSEAERDRIYRFLFRTGAAR
ncbi:MAG: PilZ domain-containing protein [Alkalispirochaetaceae bacterium]